MEELKRDVTSIIKKLCSLREPHYDFPADSFIDKASEEIIYKIFSQWKWISIKSLLPERNGFFLIIVNKKPNLSYFKIGKEGNYNFHYIKEKGIYRNVTHWMPLPESPNDNNL